MRMEEGRGRRRNEGRKEEGRGWYKGEEKEKCEEMREEEK